MADAGALMGLTLGDLLEVRSFVGRAHSAVVTERERGDPLGFCARDQERAEALLRKIADMIEVLAPGSGIVDEPERSELVLALLQKGATLN